MKKNVAFYYDCLIITAEIEILLKKKNKLTGAWADSLHTLIVL